MAREDLNQLWLANKEWLSSMRTNFVAGWSRYLLTIYRSIVNDWPNYSTVNRYPLSDLFREANVYVASSGAWAAANLLDMKIGRRPARLYYLFLFLLGLSAAVPAWHVFTTVLDGSAAMTNANTPEIVAKCIKFIEISAQVVLLISAQICSAWLIVRHKSLTDFVLITASELTLSEKSLKQTYSEFMVVSAFICYGLETQLILIDLWKSFNQPYRHPEMDPISFSMLKTTYAVYLTTGSFILAVFNVLPSILTTMVSLTCSDHITYQFDLIMHRFKIHGAPRERAKRDEKHLDKIIRDYWLDSIESDWPDFHWAPSNGLFESRESSLEAAKSVLFVNRCLLARLASLKHITDEFNRIITSQTTLQCYVVNFSSSLLLSTAAVQLRSNDYTVPSSRVDKTFWYCLRLLVNTLSVFFKNIRYFNESEQLANQIRKLRSKILWLNLNVVCTAIDSADLHLASLIAENETVLNQIERVAAQINFKFRGFGNQNKACCIHVVKNHFSQTLLAMQLIDLLLASLMR